MPQVAASPWFDTHRRYQRLRGAARSLVETAAQVAPAKPSEPDPYLEGRSE
ncbi:hypothetical protein HF289_13105 [Acidithiobacillus ferrooxidans]|uniref:hypothetical protein n=1 Tax=Acidithiobacillus ferrooxidans TaxID=920 RepID=UPI000A941A08|nr:hypothetical protein [Acidithiobacillus ferrooxidans]MBU2857770.1 hypothetical protein [Acidithiobacillus ferrooxidans]MBU2860198.1 hypothetical protein [Acidithiobacillus ferrooxidans]MCR2831861.1 hypothetical protein [Acidithiobacillus ferrooxidans]